MNECFFLFVLYVHHVAWPGLGNGIIKLVSIRSDLRTPNPDSNPTAEAYHDFISYLY